MTTSAEPSKESADGVWVGNVVRLTGFKIVASSTVLMVNVSDGESVETFPFGIVAFFLKTWSTSVASSIYLF